MFFRSKLIETDLFPACGRLFFARNMHRQSTSPFFLSLFILFCSCSLVSHIFKLCSCWATLTSFACFQEPYMKQYQRNNGKNMSYKICFFCWCMNWTCATLFYWKWCVFSLWFLAFCPLSYLLPRFPICIIFSRNKGYISHYRDIQNILC